MPLISQVLEDYKVKFREPERTPDGITRMRVGGHDKRKLMFKGWIELEDFEYEGKEGSFCVMQRDQVCVPLLVAFLLFAEAVDNQGNPISWRQLWKSIILSPVIEPHVYMKK